ncbi:MAG: (2Fe-2S)-binding protein [Acidimicrobiales bacterium]
MSPQQARRPPRDLTPSRGGGDAVYVCLCRGVTERCVQAAISAGAHDLETIARSCRAGAGCGGCHGVVEAMMAAAGTGGDGGGGQSEARPARAR